MVAGVEGEENKSVWVGIWSFITRPREADCRDGVVRAEHVEGEASEDSLGTSLSATVRLSTHSPSRCSRCWKNRLWYKVRPSCCRNRYIILSLIETFLWLLGHGRPCTHHGPFSSGNWFHCVLPRPCTFCCCRALLLACSGKRSRTFPLQSWPSSFCPDRWASWTKWWGKWSRQSQRMYGQA